MEWSEDISDDPSSDLADLRTMVLDLKRQLAAFTASDGSASSTRGYTPRADKPDRRMKTRFAATPLAKGEIRSQGVSKKEDGEALVYAIDEYTDLARHVDTGALNINTFTANVPVVPEPAKHSPAASVGSGEEWTGPPNPHPLMPQPVTRSFVDFIASTGFTVEAPDEPPIAMNMLSAIEEPESATGYAMSDYEPAETYATGDSDDEGSPIEQPPPRFWSTGS
ncbi:hypothetical protein CYMTET_27530 [Cymbomonas tetramitiformis]|uniref:Uncharacterized protein n=1 Tax=Cymbomonas tetramitiformis TaxID=36881 RepID=A0AAE0FPR9_9CHLO|nr:hypothetical protein CYMTET_27530 [Cymbomonas tetramitiformis]